MKILKIIGLVILTLILLVVITGLIAPKDYRVERSIDIGAPRMLVFNHVQYFKNWKDWSPWEGSDSTMKSTYEGADGYPGAKQSWTGDKSGVGELINTGVKANEEIGYHLNFIEPFASQADGYLRAAEIKGGTRLTWAMYGRDPFPWNVFSLLMSVEKMIGGDFEKGLAKVKEIAEKEASQIDAYQIREEAFPSKVYASIEKQVAFAEIPKFFEEAFAGIMGTMGAKGLQPAGAPTGLYFVWDEQNQSTTLAAAIPLAVARDLGPDIKIIKLAKGKAFVTDYYGPYEKSMIAYLAFDAYFQSKGLKQKPPVIEEYITDPSAEPDPAKWRTKIYFFAE